MIVLGALLLLATPAVAGEWGPWNDTWPPVERAAEARPGASQEPPAGVFEWAYRQYRGASRPGVASCPYYPTCSGYGILAVRAHGPVLGPILTLERLLREHPWLERTGPNRYPLVTPHGEARLHDPVP